MVDVPYMMIMMIQHDVATHPTGQLNSPNYNLIPAQVQANQRSPGFFLNPATFASGYGTACLMANTAFWGFLGVNMVLPIGGADMPVVVSLLNAFSGLATSAAGFMLSNDLLTISGSSTGWVFSGFSRVFEA